jgi:GYF domain 2
VNPTGSVVSLIAAGTVAVEADPAIPEPEEPAATRKPKAGRISAKHVWHYTSEGERLGPVTFDELRLMAAESRLDPRLDMVWKKSMDSWKPAGQIDGLFERHELPAAPRGSLAPAAVAAQPRPTTSLKPASGIKPWPGARRRSLLLIALVFPFAWHFALIETRPFLTGQFGSILMGKFLPITAFMPMVILLYFAARRLVNLGMSRLWILAIPAPLLNLWLGYRCLTCPAGYASHRKMDGPGYALAILYWLSLAALGLVLAPLMPRYATALQNPELLARLRDLIASL